MNKVTSRPKKFEIFAIYGWMVFCFISTDLACLVQDLVDWAFGIIRCIGHPGVRVLNAHPGRMAGPCREVMRLYELPPPNLIRLSTKKTAGT